MYMHTHVHVHMYTHDGVVMMTMMMVHRVRMTLPTGNGLPLLNTLLTFPGQAPPPSSTGIQEERRVLHRSHGHAISSIKRM